jgi:hypothetical protein
MIYTPEMNDGINVFVFGSNLAGIHGAGAAKEALVYWGAQWGVGEGRVRDSYALPTKDRHIKTLPLAEIEKHVKRFFEIATARWDRTFLVTRIGCGLAGYKDSDIAPMFKDAPSNCVMPDEWKEYL